MRRADRLRHAMRLNPIASGCVLAALACLAGSEQARAQGVARPDGPPVLHYSPLAADAALTPRAPGQDPQPGAVFLGERGGVAYAANAAVGRLVVEVDRNGVPADGQSAVRLTVRVYGHDGAALTTPVFVTLEHSGGRLLLPGARTDEFGPRRLDADRSTPGVQLRVVDGAATVTLLAPEQAMDVRLRASAGAQEAAGVISFLPDVRPMLAVGLVEGVINLRNGGVQPVQRGDVFEREIRRWSHQFDGGKASVDGRAAFYLKGQVRGDVLLTAAFDSDKDSRARLLRDIRPDELYPVYGDSSLRSVDAQSAQRLFVRVDHGKSYALYGDLTTGDGFTQAPLLGGGGPGQGATASLKQRSLGAYNRSATGAKLHHERDGLVANLVVFNDSLRQSVEEFASQGSGPYGLRNNAVLEGSEKLEVLVRDRAQPSRIVSVRPLQRLVDYSFEPFSGRILLAQFLPAFDEQLNPVSLRVSYEVDQGGDRFWVGMGDAQWRLTDSLEIGGALVRDANPLAPYTLGSANASVRFGPRTALVAEVARSQSTVNTNPVNGNGSAGLANQTGDVSGQAWRLEFTHEGEKARVQAFVGRTDPRFDNAAAPLNGGRGEARLLGEYKLADNLLLKADGLASEDRNLGGGDRSALGAGLRWQASERLSLEAGLRSQRETVGSQGNGPLSAPFGSTTGLTGSLGSGAAGGALGYGNQTIDTATGLPVIGSGGLGTSTPTLAAGTKLKSDSVRLGAGWRATDRVTLGAEVEEGVAGADRRRIALGGDVALAERTRAYGRVERQSGWVQLAGSSDTGRSANVLVAGVDTSYLKDTQAFSEYRLRDALSGRDAQVASGVRQGFDIADGLRASAGYERVSVLSGNTAAAQAATLGLDYTADPLWRGNTRLEVRRSGDIASTAEDDRFTTTLWQVMAARKLDRDWTLLARNYALYTDYAAKGDVLQDRAQLGLAWRPVDSNRINALGRLEHMLERDASNAAVGNLSSRAWIGSVIADWHPSRPWWATGRVAAKWQTDQFEGGVRDSFNAQLLAGRVVYDITERWDIGALAAMQLGQGARQGALGVEGGYLVATNLWLSAGFNVSGFRGDADLSGYEYTRRGAYLRLRFKFDETLFRSGDPVVNRSLDR
jgi:hypothetical protein